jgi:hypothetical protein
MLPFMTKSARLSLKKQRLKTDKPDLVRIFRLVKYELNSLAGDWRGRLSMRQRSRLRRLRQSHGLKLNIASGRATKPGWINIDVSPAARYQDGLAPKAPDSRRVCQRRFLRAFLRSLEFPRRDLSLSARMSPCS